MVTDCGCSFREELLLVERTTVVEVAGTGVADTGTAVGTAATGSSSAWTTPAKNNTKLSIIKVRILTVFLMEE
jgi:hypothetical protein